MDEDEEDDQISNVIDRGKSKDDNNIDVDKDSECATSIKITKRKTLVALSTLRSTVKNYDEEYENANNETRNRVSNNNKPIKKNSVNNKTVNYNTRNGGSRIRPPLRFAYVQVGGEIDDSKNDDDYDEDDDRNGLNQTLYLEKLRKVVCSILKQKL